METRKPFVRARAARSTLESSFKEWKHDRAGENSGKEIALESSFKEWKLLLLPDGRLPADALESSFKEWKQLWTSPTISAKLSS